MCGLAYYLESEGITTIVIGLVPQHVRAMVPPRALIVPFGFGRPLGAPGDAVLQHSVLGAALQLLDATAPVIESLAKTVSATAAVPEPWVCPVSFPAATSSTSLESRITREVELLTPWFDLGKRNRGYSAADVSGLDRHTIVHWLCEFLEDSTLQRSPNAAESLAEMFKLAVEDLKAFYLEAVMAEPGSREPQELDNWFWHETAAAELLQKLRLNLTEHPDKGVQLHAQFTLVPAAQR